MTDSDRNLIPLVEDDQGEGIKDFIDDLGEIEELLRGREEETYKSEFGRAYDNWKSK